MEGDDNTYDSKAAGSRIWAVGATVNSLLGTLSHDDNTHRNQFNISFTIGIHNFLHEFWEPWSNRAILDPVVYRTVLLGVPTVYA